MTKTVWQLDGHIAQLRTGPLTASLDVLHPQAGMTNINYAGESFAGASCLCVKTPENTGENAENLVEYYVRGSDLIATYQQTDGRAFRPQIYWRSVSFQSAIGIELIISTQTSLLESHPSLTVDTTLNSQEVWAQHSNGFEKRSASVDGSTNLHLFRFGTGTSYAQFAHPTDFQRSSLRLSDESSGTHLMHSLFSDYLEKGVIRRARVQAVFLPQHNDFAEITECLAQFASMAPPLTT